MLTPTRSTIHFDALQIPTSAVKLSLSSNSESSAQNIDVDEKERALDLERDQLDKADLTLAIQIANRFLADDSAVTNLKKFIRNDGDSKQMHKSKWTICENKIEQTIVSYQVLKRNEKCAASWIFEYQLDNGEKTLGVAINSFLQYRLNQIRELLKPKLPVLEKQSPTTSMEMRQKSTLAEKDEEMLLTNAELEREHQIIVVFMGFCIFHEVAHLVIRWTGYKSTPEDFIVANGLVLKPEAGAYLEIATFKGIVKIFAMPEKGHWIKNSVYKGLGFETIAKAPGVEVRTRFKFSDSYIIDLYNLAYENNINKYTYPKFDNNLSSINNTKSIGKGDSDDDEDEQVMSTAITISSVLEGAVSLEDLGVSKCGFHLDD